MTEYKNMETNTMKISALILSGMIAFASLTSTPAKAHGRDSDAAAAIAGAAIILGLGIAAARADRRRYRRHHHHNHYYYGHGRPYYGFEPDYEPQYRLRDYRHDHRRHWRH